MADLADYFIYKPVAVIVWFCSQDGDEDFSKIVPSADFFTPPRGEYFMFQILSSVDLAHRESDSLISVLSE